MQVPVQITMRNLENSEAIEARIQQKIDKLNQFSAQLISCDVVVEQNQAYRQHGEHYNVKIRVGTPGKALIVNHNAQENLYLAIRNAFDNMIRQIRSSKISHHPKHQRQHGEAL